MVSVYMKDILVYMNFALATIILGCTSSFVFLLTVWLVSRVDTTDYNMRQWSEELDVDGEREKLNVNETTEKSIIGQERSTFNEDL